MNKLRVWLALVLAYLSSTSSVRAQQASTGSRVRIVESTSRRVVEVGQLLRLANDTATILPKRGAATDTPLHFVLGNQHRLEQSAGMHRRTLRGLGIGFLVGAASGAMLGSATYKKPECGAESIICLDFGRGFATGAGAITLSVPGALIGALVGRSQTHEVWRVKNQRDLRISIIPTAQGRVRLMGALSF